jgi:hypothetical protein
MPKKSPNYTRTTIINVTVPTIRPHKLIDSTIGNSRVCARDIILLNEEYSTLL